MKIAFMPSTFLPWVGGAEIQTHNTANKMVELGHEVDIFLLNKVKINNKKYSLLSKEQIFKKITKLNTVIDLIKNMKIY